MPGPGTSRGKYTLGSPAAKKRARRTTVVPSKGSGSEVVPTTTTRSNAKQIRSQNRASRAAAVRRVRRAEGVSTKRAEEIAKDFYKSKRARATNRRAELGVEEHPDAPKGFDKIASDLVPDDPVEIALTVAAPLKAVGAGAKILKGTQAARGAAKGAKTAAKASAGAAAKKGASKAATKAPKTAARAKRTKSVVSKSVAKAKQTKAGRAASKVNKSKPVQLSRRHSGKTALAAIEAPAAVTAVKKGDPEALTAPIEGTVKAVVENPRKTGSTTLSTLPSLITAPIGLAANVGLTGGRAASSAAHSAGIPGARAYSGEEIAAPAKRSGEELAGFAKHYAETYGSGDAERIQKATEDEFGIAMALPALGALRGAKRRGHSASPRTKRGKRKEVSREVASTKRKAAVEGMALPDALDKITGHKGRRTQTKKTPSGRRREQVIPAALSTGATQPRHLVADAAARNRGKRHEEASGDTITRHDVAEDARRDPDLLNDRQVDEALAVVRSEQPRIETSEVKKWEGVMVTAGIKHPWERKGYTKNPKTAAQAAKNRKLERDAVNEAKAWARADGRAEPVYVQSVDARKVPPGKGETSNVRGTAGRPSHRLDLQSTAALNRAGLEDLSYETFRVRSGFEPRAKRALNEGTHDFLERESKALPVGGKAERWITEKEKNRLIAQGEWVDPKTGKKVKADDLIWIDAQTGKAAVRDRKSGENIEVEVFQEPLADAITRRELEGAKGKKFFAVDRVKGEEFLAQHGRLREGAMQKVGQGLLPTQRVASTALLGYSPSWLLAQPVAEAAQALAAVGPVQMYKGNRRYKKMSPEQQRAFDARIGATAGTGSIYSALTDVRQISRSSDGKGAVTKAVKETNEGLKSHPVGRVVQGLITGRYANSIDRTKGLAIRRAVAAGHMEREFNGLTGALRRLTREQDALDHRMRSMTPQQRMEFVAKNPVAARRVEGYVDDVMGNWSALTTNERALSGAVIFYPFIRMSLEWTALTYPARHPLKAAALQFLAQQNAQQVENLLGGKPSFFSQWANVPLYAGEDGEPTSLLPLGRIAPGSNALIEAAGDSDNTRSPLRAINPFLSAAVAAYAGYDPLSGRSEVEKYARPSYLDMLRSFGDSVAKLPAPVRIADAATGGKISKFISGEATTPTGMLFDSLDGDEKREVLKALVPFVLQNTQKERQRQEIGRLLERKYAADGLDFFKDVRPAVIAATKGGKDPRGSEAEEMVVTYLDALVASNRLNKLYQQYGIPKPKDLKGRAANIAQATGDMTIPGTWNNIIESAVGMGESDRPTGLNVKRLKKLRRARARERMGNS